MRTSEERSEPMPVAILMEYTHLAPDVIACLNEHGIEPFIVDRAESVLRTLYTSLDKWDAVVCPISACWQRGLDFVRALRCLRERCDSQIWSSVLILSTTAQHPTTVDLFRRTNGTRYAVFTSSNDLTCILELMRQESFESKREAHKLHLRLVHVGNSAGIGCIRYEQLLAVYASFQPGKENQIQQSPSVLQFLNLLAVNHWRFRTATEIVQLMRKSPFYAGGAVISVSSVKTYISRIEEVLSEVWRKAAGLGEPPRLIARESRIRKKGRLKHQPTFVRSVVNAHREPQGGSG